MSQTDRLPTPPMFHADEREAQRRAGFSGVTGAIRPFMPEQHRDFLALLPYLFVATLDGSGWPVATVVTGSPGFVSAPDSATMRIGATVPQSDPAAAGVIEGRDAGVLGLDLATRRRNRANGRIARVDPTGLTLSVTQSFGNCAQYIQRRAVRLVTPEPESPVEWRSALDGAAQLLISRADTFFVASRASPRLKVAGSVDVSHRGGRPGFVGFNGETLLIPDFRGNRFFNTLGNFLGDPRGALMFLDFERGDALQVQGRAEVDWDARPGVAGAERTWRFHPERAWWRPGAINARWAFIDAAPTTTRTGVWDKPA